MTDRVAQSLETKRKEVAGSFVKNTSKNTNRRSTLIASDDYPSIKTYITNYREFAQA